VGQNFEQCELARSQRHVSSGSRYALTRRVELNIRDPDEGRRRRVTSPQRSYSRKELSHGEGFDQVVVGAAVQPCYAVIDSAEGSEHQNRHGRVLTAAVTQVLGDGEPRPTRKNEVKHDKVVWIDVCELKGCADVGSVVDGEGFALKGDAYGVSDGGFVFNEENAHHFIMRVRA
jgi:hypothetical protein